jgi:hypothetical protein
MFAKKFAKNFILFLKILQKILIIIGDVIFR